MTRLSLVAVGLLTALWCGKALAADETTRTAIDPAAYAKAVDRAIEFLQGRQSPDGPSRRKPDQA